jgi:hypothetical protein
VAVSHPANWGPFKIDLLRHALDLAGLRSVTLLTNGFERRSPQELMTSAHQAIGRSHERAADPLADPDVVEICEAAACTGEAIYGAAQQAQNRTLEPTRR